jgi:hypothetical protein
LSASHPASGGVPRRANRLVVPATLAIAAATPSVLGASAARADVPPSEVAPAPQPTPSPRDRARDDDTSLHRPRVGAIAGVGFPHPLSIEAMVKIDDYLSIGGEYGVLPTITIDQVDTHLWSLSADGRVFPFRNAFFLGLRVGRQHVGATGTVDIASVGGLPEQLALDSWFVNPRVGVLWTAPSGFTVGAEAGIQIPISPSVTSSLPLAYAPEAERTIDTLGKTVLPTIDLLQIGMLF